MNRTPRETAIILALILKRGGLKRARLSSKTVKLAGKRKHLRGAFVVELIDAMAEYGWTMDELEIGGFGVLQTKSLEAAKAVTVKTFLSDEEKWLLRRDGADFALWEAEISSDEDSEDGDADEAA